MLLVADDATQHTRIRAYNQSAQTPLPFIASAYPTGGAPDAVNTSQGRKPSRR
jgi:hypothetical protein